MIFFASSATFASEEVKVPKEIQKSRLARVVALESYMKKNCPNVLEMKESISTRSWLRKFATGEESDDPIFHEMEMRDTCDKRKETAAK